jgi:uncharacterized short protein YbdD (DUF466 family)
MNARALSGLRHRWHGAVAATWQALRALSGDDAYERYAAHARARHPGERALTRREFYDAELRRKWSGVNRCC